MSSQIAETEVDLAAVNGGGNAGAGVPHGAALLAFTEAVMRGEAATLERKHLRALLPPDLFVDVAAVIGAFNTVDRIADATGIPLDSTMYAMSAEVRRELNLGRFPSAANTPHH